MSGPAARPRPSGNASLHPRNRHRGRYDMAALQAVEPGLSAFLQRSPAGDDSIDFANPDAVRCLNRALLRHHYGIRDWQLPPGYLCPPIPGRVDYLHYLADLLAGDNAGAIPTGPGIRALDIGTGANLVYPLLGQYEYGWQFVGADIDAGALANAAAICQRNPSAAAHIALRHQEHPDRLLHGIVQPGERFAFTLSNPPFHRSQQEASAGSARKWRGLGKGSQGGKRPALNFGGQSNELICPGGEVQFVTTLVQESTGFREQIVWFTSLIAQASHLPAIYRALQRVGPDTVRTIEMAQGQKQSRFVAWSFLPLPVRRQQLASHR